MTSTAEMQRRARSRRKKENKKNFVGKLSTGIPEDMRRLAKSLGLNI